MKSILDFKQAKINQQKITMISAYDYPTARVLAQTTIDTILVGDSVAMVLYGYKDTTFATVEMIAEHTAAIRRGAPDKFIVSDMPFLSNRKGINHAVDMASKLILSGANAVKIEGSIGHLDVIKHLVESGIPVMGHLGLTPQFLHQLGGFRVQGRDEQGHRAIIEQAQSLQDNGVFSLVLECVPQKLATEITQSLDIPTIGIGAGINCDGQVLVYHDAVGALDHKLPKFVRKYHDSFNQQLNAISSFNSDVKNLNFPQDHESYQ